MAKKPLKYKPTTRAKVVSDIRRYIWLRSNERSYAEKRDGYTCQKCGRKKSKAKGKECTTNVHHLVEMEGALGQIADLILDLVLVSPEKLQTLCKECHKAEHGVKKQDSR